MGSKVVVLGASGFAGAELLGLLSAHPGIDVVAAGASSKVGVSLGEFYPQLTAYAAMSFVSTEEAKASEPDLVFSSLPHTHSMKLFGSYEGRVVDLAGDFRLHDAELYPKWYGEDHLAPDVLGDWVYGLTEFHRDEISTAQKVANPGCYAAAAILALAPLVSGNLIDGGSIHIDAKSGVSGAGRASGEGFDFVSVNENLRPYTVTGHKHIAEIEQELSELAGTSVQTSFVPHLVPMTRGIVVTCTAHLRSKSSAAELLGLYEETYSEERFVRVLSETELPETKRLTGTNLAEVTVRVDERTSKAIAICALDNLGKGAAGQAIQNANLMLGFDEATAL